MTSQHDPGAFGAPRIAVAPFVDTRACTACPLAIFRELGAASGRVLFESVDQHRSARQSILVTRALLRLEIRGETAHVRALESAGEPLLDALANELPGERDTSTLIANVPGSPGDPGTPDRERIAEASALDAVRALAGLVGDLPSGARIAPGAFGAFSYEIVDRFEPLPARRPDPLGEPDASFVLGTDLIVIDHESGQAQVITRGLPWEEHLAVKERHGRYLSLLEVTPAHAPLPRQIDPKQADADISNERFLGDVDLLLEHIREGDIFQAVLSRGLTMRSDATPLDVYAALRERNPSPYMFHVDLGDGVLLGSSPETFLKYQDGTIEVRPIAGTVARGFGEDGRLDEELDGRLALSLLLDPKEQAEHAMLLDLARNDVARVSKPGTCRVVQQFAIEKYSHVQHLVSRVQGELRDGLDALHAYRAAANTGTLTGAPKVKAMQVIREREPTSRGYYGGACGYLLQDGSFDSCIVIRSLRYKNGCFHTRAGAGIVAKSTPERELLETEHKSRSCRVAVAAAEAMAS